MINDFEQIIEYACVVQADPHGVRFCCFVTQSISYVFINSSVVNYHDTTVKLVNVIKDLIIKWDLNAVQLILKKKTTKQKSSISFQRPKYNQEKLSLLNACFYTTLFNSRTTFLDKMKNKTECKQWLYALDFIKLHHTFIIYALMVLFHRTSAAYFMFIVVRNEFKIYLNTQW